MTSYIFEEIQYSDPGIIIKIICNKTTTHTSDILFIGVEKINAGSNLKLIVRNVLTNDEEMILYKALCNLTGC